MNSLDIIITVPLLYGILRGFSNGVIKEITSILGVILGVYIAINFSSHLQPKITETFELNKEIVPIISFAILFIAVLLSIRAIGYFLEKITKALTLGLLSKFLGAIFGFLKMTVLCSFIVFILIENNLINKKTKQESILLGPLEKIIEKAIPQIKKETPEILKEINNKTKKVKDKIIR